MVDKIFEMTGRSRQNAIDLSRALTLLRRQESFHVTLTLTGGKLRKYVDLEMCSIMLSCCTSNKQLQLQSVKLSLGSSKTTKVSINSI